MQHRAGFYERFVKRFLDMVLSGMALLMLSPVLLVTAMIVRVKLGSPVIFCQERPGKDEKIFRLHKFRSMSDARDENGALLPDEVRLGRFGRILRATSIDELPELFDIFRGKMSIVGPRPLLVEYLPYYTEGERHRHDVRPGLTGLAQINGRNALNWEDRFRYDLTYVNHVSFVMDAKIVFGTIGKVLHHSGVQSGADQTIPDLDAYRKNAGKAAAEEVAESAGSSKELKGYNHGGA